MPRKPFVCMAVWIALFQCHRGFSSTAPSCAPYQRMYVFGDSYSDIGEGYLDGNGPTAVAYLASRLGFSLKPANDPSASEASLDFAISGGQSGAGSGTKMGAALLGVGMRNQVDDFAARVRSGKIRFEKGNTLFFLAGGLNDGNLKSGKTASNLEGDITLLYKMGARRFMVALLPTEIPGFAAVGKRLNPEIARIPEDLKRSLPEAQIYVSHWGPFFDRVMLHPAQYGILNTRDACAGRAIFHQDPAPCSHPDSYFYYHQDHPSTAVHKAVGDELYQEAISLYCKSPAAALPSKR